MGSALYVIECKNCGGLGCIDDEYKEGYKVTDCDDCDYMLKEFYDIETREVYESNESGKGSPKHQKQT